MLSPGLGISTYCLFCEPGTYKKGRLRNCKDKKLKIQLMSYLNAERRTLYILIEERVTMPFVHQRWATIPTRATIPMKIVIFLPRIVGRLCYVSEPSVSDCDLFFKRLE